MKHLFLLLITLFVFNLGYTQTYDFNLYQKDSLFRLTQKTYQKNNFGTVDTTSQTFTLGVRKQMVNDVLISEFQLREKIDSLRRVQLSINLELQKLNSNPTRLRNLFIINKEIPEYETVLNQPFYNKFNGSYQMTIQEQQNPLMIEIKDGFLIISDSLKFQFTPFTLNSAIGVFDEKTFVYFSYLPDLDLFISDNGVIILRRKEEKE